MEVTGIQLKNRRVVGLTHDVHATMPNPSAQQIFLMKGMQQSHK